MNKKSIIKNLHWKVKCNLCNWWCEDELKIGAYEDIGKHLIEKHNIKLTRVKYE
jgi:hypothetical protein